MSDCIDREEIEYENWKGVLSNPITVVRKCVIDSMPAADVAPVVHGRWIEKTAPAVHKYYECSKCGAHENKHTAIKGRYCWRCGARMDCAK